MATTDYFSQHADQYALYRPTYPADLFEYIVSACRGRDRAWDCATGNGQAAIPLARQFKSVMATDISQSQLSQAPHLPNISYSISKAESTSFPDKHFDLITVAQALHWLETEAFWREVRRVGKTGAVVACWGYGMFRSTPVIDEVVGRYYADIVGPYWPARRKHVETAYQEIPFPFEKIKMPPLGIQLNWSLDQLLAYLGTWSSTQRYKNDRKTDPVELIREELENAWGEQGETKSLEWPIFMLMGRI